MLKLVDGTPGGSIIDTDDFSITYKSNGLDELVFNLSIYDPVYASLQEEREVEYEQPYLIKAIDGGSSTAKVKCQLNLDDLKATLTVGYSNNSATLKKTVEGILPKGWVFDDQSKSAIRRTVEGDYTPYDVLSACMDTYGVVFRFDVKGKKMIAYTLANFEPNGAFASRDLNLKEINYKGKSASFVTRLYAYGKDRLSFSSINGGRPYVDNHLYSDKVICAIWEDDRYTDPESLMAAAEEKLSRMAVPERSYECSVQDLKATDPKKYGFLDFGLFQVVRLIDDIRGESVLYQVVEYQTYPYYPEKNTVTLSSTAPKMQNTVKSLSEAMDNQASVFWTVVKKAVDAGAGWVSGSKGGYVQIRQDTVGRPVELLVLDDAALADARQLIRCDASGIAISHNGYGGLWETVLPITGDYLAAQELRVMDTDGNLVLKVNWDGSAVTANGVPLATQEYVSDGFIGKKAYTQDQQETAEEITDLKSRVTELEELTKDLQERLGTLEQAGGETTE